MTDYGMFTDEGNARIGEIVEEAKTAATVEAALNAVDLGINLLAQDPEYAEAEDPTVIDDAYAEIALHFGDPS